MEIKEYELDRAEFRNGMNHLVLHIPYEHNLRIWDEVKVYETVESTLEIEGYKNNMLRTSNYIEGNITSVRGSGNWGDKLKIIVRKDLAHEPSDQLRDLPDSHFTHYMCVDTENFEFIRTQGITIEHTRKIILPYDRIVVYETREGKYTGSEITVKVSSIGESIDGNESKLTISVTKEIPEEMVDQAFEEIGDFLDVGK